VVVLDDDACYAALTARDPRFDGVFFVGVATTGIYCRPICPARTPGRARCTFFATAALAERAGFRACFRCRPEIAPGNASVDAVDGLVAAAARRIVEGAANERSFRALARELGVSDRHVRRALEQRLGVSPVELAQTARLALAKQLLHDTSLSLADIAFAAGFRSVRRFNAVFAQRMGAPPSRLRPAQVRARGTSADARGARPRAGDIALRLDYRPPYDFARLLAFLRARAIPGVEIVGDDTYRRVAYVGERVGMIEVARAERRDALVLRADAALLPVAMPLVARVRALFDLDARPDVVARAFASDPLLAPLVRRRPGLRVPGALDPFEAAMRAMLGQQVSVAAATTLAGRFAAELGVGEPPMRRFPNAREVAAAGADRIAKLGMPGARGAAIAGLADAVASGALRLDAARDLDAFVADATRLPGIGAWTAHYLAMRALHAPDAFPAADLGVRKALGDISARDAEARARAWRPFRSYAVLHLWTALSEGGLQ
jgi:AraC family transcriptional regulator of adaptative response / DNA-3-methyladenine glycosylase II